MLYFLLAVENKGDKLYTGEVADDLQQLGIKNSACLVIPLKSGHLLLHMGPLYLRGKVWVASGETGHNPNVTSSYQAQGPSFLEYIPDEE